MRALLLLLSLCLLAPALVGCAATATANPAEYDGDAAALAALAEQTANQPAPPRASLIKILPPAAQPAQPTPACECEACRCAPCQCQPTANRTPAPAVRQTSAPQVVCDGQSCRVVGQATQHSHASACQSGACGGGRFCGRGPVRAVVGAPVRLWGRLQPARRVLRGVGCLFGRCR